MQDFEVGIILDSIEYADRQSWEQARMVAYIQAATWSKKKIAPEDLVKFPWDGKHDDKNQEITKKEIAMMEKKAKFWEDYFSKQKDK